MRKLLIAVLALAALGCVGAGIYLFAKHQKDTLAAEQDQRDRSGPAFCATRPIAGAMVCFTDEQQCTGHDVACEQVENYACVRGIAKTDSKKTKWCFRKFGDCADFLLGLKRDAEYGGLGECLVYRTHS